MPALSDYTAGTITLTNGSVNFTGAGTGWQAADFREGDTILGIEDNAGVEYVIASITGNGAGTLTQEWGGATGTYTYRMRYLADGARVTAQARNLIELLGNGNLQALAGLTGPGVPVFNGPHAMTIKPEADFINGVAYDVQVDTIADRAAYDGQSEGFAVLVSDIGDGRSALFSKASNTSGDWTDPAYITGPVGDTGPQGDPGSGFNWIGEYNPANSYVVDDVVGSNGSTFIAIQAVPPGEAPSGAYPPVDTAYWQVIAVRGQNGTGDVVGPGGGVVDSGLVAFDGTTGKLIKAAAGVTNAQLATMPAATVKARRSGDGTGAVADVSALHLGIFAPPGFSVADLTPSETFALLDNHRGFYKLASQIGGPIQMPPGFPQAFGVIEGYLEPSNDYGYSWQELTGPSDNQKWMRRATSDSTWGPWQEIYHQGNILGTVSQSAGVPTGAIIERGSNANGSYVRFADGTQICTFVGSPSGLTTFTLPAQYANTDYRVGAIVESNTTNSVISAKASSKTTTSIVLLITASLGTGGVTTPQAPIDCVISGVWF